MDAYSRATTENLHLGHCKVSKVAVIDALSLGAARTWMTTQENTRLQFQQVGKSK
jgi:hypothetical protein